MYYINTTHVDMGGKHKYSLRASSWPLISEIKAWLASQQTNAPSEELRDTKRWKPKCIVHGPRDSK
jgi:hypothetical protein